MKSTCLASRWTLAFAICIISAGQLQQSAAAATESAEFSGKVVDDETGQPVSDFAVQWGMLEKGKKGITWGYGLTTLSRRNGDSSFHDESGWQPDAKVTVRIIADGYVPQPVTSEAVDLPVHLNNLVVRLKRGATLSGVILDQAGKPADQAKVYVADGQPLELTNGAAESFKGSSATTDISGEFALRGLDPSADHRFVFVSASGTVALASNRTLAKPFTMQMPSAAKVVVNYDIANDQAVGQLRIEQKTWEMKEWSGIAIVRKSSVKNQSQVEVTDLTPGTYDFFREKQLRVGDMGRSAFCDRQTVTLKAGETQTINLTRPGGRSISGEVVGMKEVGVRGVFITIRSPEATGDMEKDWKLMQYDGLACKSGDGHFKSAALLPGQYTVLVEGYLPETQEQRGSTGFRRPDCVNITKVIVPADRDPEAVKIVLKEKKQEK